MNSLRDIVERNIVAIQPRSSANRCSTVQEEMVSSRSRNSSNVPRGAQGKHFLSSIIRGIASREIAAGREKCVVCIIGAQ